MIIPARSRADARTGGHLHRREGGVKIARRSPHERGQNCTPVHSRIALGVDIKGEGGYVVAPPSLHASGKSYVWVEGYEPWVKKPLVQPEAWQAIVERRATITESKATSAGTQPKADVIPEGKRNDTLTSIAGSMRARGRSVAEVEAELRKINGDRCRPPLDDAEVVKIAASSERWAAGAGEPGAAERVMQAYLDSLEAEGKRIRFEHDHEFYLFGDTHWGQLSEKLLQREVHDLIRAKFPTERRQLFATAKAVINLLEIEAAADDDALHFVSEPPPVINVANGEVWLLPDGQIELRPHSPDTGMRHVLPVSFDPAAKCPDYDKAMAAILSKASSPRRMMKVMHQLMAYAIQPNRMCPTIAVFFGPGGDGKTKFVQTIAHLLGRDAVYSGDVSRLETSPFAIGSLSGKLLFIDDDVKAGAKLPDGVLKKISEGKEVTGERKYKDAFNFVCRALPILISNNTPSLADLSQGIRRRLKVFPLQRQFSEEEQDKTLFDRIWKNELSGILNHALQGWKEFVANGHTFTRSKDLDRAKLRLLVEANPLAAYIDEACEKNPGASISVADLYDNFSDWSQDSGYNHAIVRNKMRSLVIGLGFKVKMIHGYPHVVGLTTKAKVKKPHSWV